MCRDNIITENEPTLTTNQQKPFEYSSRKIKLFHSRHTCVIWTYYVLLYMFVRRGCVWCVCLCLGMIPFKNTMQSRRKGQCVPVQCIFFHICLNPYAPDEFPKSYFQRLSINRKAIHRSITHIPHSICPKRAKKYSNFILFGFRVVWRGFYFWRFVRETSNYCEIALAIALYQKCELFHSDSVKVTNWFLMSKRQWTNKTRGDTSIRECMARKPFNQVLSLSLLTALSRNRSQVQKNANLFSIIV